MSKDPAFLLYVNDFISGTMFLSDEQLGKYFRLLLAQHQHGHLREKDMLKICSEYDEDIWNKFIKDENGLFYNERLETETVKRKSYSESRSTNRKKKETPIINEDIKNISSTHENDMVNENINKDKDKDIGGTGGKRKFQVPTLAEVASYCQERKNSVDSFKFYNFYQSKGWKVGSNPMKDWKACVHTWEKTEKPNSPHQLKQDQINLTEQL